MSGIARLRAVQLQAVQIEVVLGRVLPNNTHRAHLAGRMLPSICQSDRANARMEQAFIDPPYEPQGGN
jgi:predicted RNA methylase